MRPYIFSSQDNVEVHPCGLTVSMKRRPLSIPRFGAGAADIPSHHCPGNGLAFTSRGCNVKIPRTDGGEVPVYS